jgi:hypothetical protein
MSDTFYILVIGVIIVAILLSIRKFIRLFQFTQEQKKLIDSDSEEARGQRWTLRIIQALIILPVVFIVIYILIKQVIG